MTTAVEEAIIAYAEKLVSTKLFWTLPEDSLPPGPELLTAEQIKMVRSACHLGRRSRILYRIYKEGVPGIAPGDSQFLFESQCFVKRLLDGFEASRPLPMKAALWCYEIGYRSAESGEIAARPRMTRSEYSISDYEVR